MLERLALQETIGHGTVRAKEDRSLAYVHLSIRPTMEPLGSSGSARREVTRAGMFTILHRSACIASPAECGGNKTAADLVALFRRLHFQISQPAPFSQSEGGRN